MKGRLIRIMDRTVRVLTDQWRAGAFDTTRTEYPFQMTVDPELLVIQGKIDRLDLAEKNGKLYARVIDYKSGSRQLDYTRIYYGLQLQLLIYMEAVREYCGRDAGAQIVPAGVYYYHIDDPIVDAGTSRSAEEEILSARPLLPSSVLSHRDLDPKNVLWDGISPYVIDWESAGEINPAAELLETLLSWSDTGVREDAELRVDEKLFRPLFDAYRAERSVDGEPWDAVFAASPDAMSDWLAFSVRRAAGIEAADAHDRLVGASETAGTLRLLEARRRTLPVVREWMGV